MMAKKNLAEEKKLTAEQKMIGSVSSFAQKYRIIIIVLAAVIVVGIITAIVIVNLNENARNKAQLRIAELEEEYSTVLAAEAQDWSSLASELEAMIKGSSYASVKAAYLLGMVRYQQEDYAGAQAAFEQAYGLNTKIYLASLSLVNAAACAEEGGDTAKALELYNKVYSDYPESGSASKALFNVARIYYQQGNTQLAKATFEQVTDYYPNSEYGKLALNISNVL